MSCIWLSSRVWGKEDKAAEWDLKGHTPSVILLHVLIMDPSAAYYVIWVVTRLRDSEQRTNLEWRWYVKRRLFSIFLYHCEPTGSDGKGRSASIITKVTRVWPIQRWNGDEVTKAKGKKEHGFSSGNCTPTVLLEIVRVLGVIRDEHTVKTTHSNQSNKALESLAKEFTFYTERTLGVFRGWRVRGDDVKIKSVLKRSTWYQCQNYGVVCTGSGVSTLRNSMDCNPPGFSVHRIF